MAQINNDAAMPDGSAVSSPVYRHRLPVRMWHWVNVLAMTGLFMSGLMIFNAHPRLYWGHYGANADPAWLDIGRDGAGHGQVRIGALVVASDGVLGRAGDAAGVSRNRAFPHWITLPGSYDLAGARHYHFFFAWMFSIGLSLFLLWGLLSGHVWRDVRPKLVELAPRHLWHEVKDHARLKFPTGAAAARFNTLQKISYFGVLCVALPGIIATGLAMSPAMDAAWPWLLDIFGGRQSARSIHFLLCWAMVAFVVVHLIMVVLAGPINELRSMVTGWFRLPPERADEGEGAA